jgi:hypothetical protein
MRGVGEPDFEHDFPPGSDIMGDIRNGPKAAERMTFELCSRLANYVDIVSDEVVSDESASDKEFSSDDEFLEGSVL